MEGHGDGGIIEAVEEEDEVEIGDGDEEGGVEGSVVEGEDGEDQGVADDAELPIEGLLDGLAGGGGTVEAPHQRQFCGVQGAGGGHRDGGGGGRDLPRAAEPEVLQQDEGSGVGRQFERLDFGFRGREGGHKEEEEEEGEE